MPAGGLEVLKTGGSQPAWFRAVLRSLAEAQRGGAEFAELDAEEPRRNICCIVAARL